MFALKRKLEYHHNMLNDWTEQITRRQMDSDTLVPGTLTFGLRRGAPWLRKLACKAILTEWNKHTKRAVVVDVLERRGCSDQFDHVMPFLTIPPIGVHLGTKRTAVRNILERRGCGDLFERVMSFLTIPPAGIFE